MSFNFGYFMVGFVGGSWLIFLSVSESILWGSIVMGLLMGLLHEGYHKSSSNHNKESKG